MICPQGLLHHRLSVLTGSRRLSNAFHSALAAGCRETIPDPARRELTSQLLSACKALEKSYPTIRISPSGSRIEDPTLWVWSHWVSSPQGQEFQVQTDPLAWGRQRQITAYA